MSAIDRYLEKKASFAQGGMSVVKSVADHALSGIKALGRSAGDVVNTGSIGRLAGEAGLLAGAAAIGYAGQNAYYAATKSNDFNKMLGFDPELAQHHEQNPKMFRQLYSSFRNMNPQFASDPVVSAHFMRNMVGEPAAAGRVIVESLSKAPDPREYLRLPGVGPITSDPLKNKQHQLEREKFDFTKDQAGQRQKLDQESHAFAVQDAARRAQLEESKHFLARRQVRAGIQEKARDHAQRDEHFNRKLDFDAQNKSDQLEQFERSHNQRDDHFGHSFDQKERHHNDRRP